VKQGNPGEITRRHWLARYGIAAAAILGCLALIRIPVIGQGFGVLVFLAIFLSAWHGGLGPGLFATLLFDGLVGATMILAKAPFTAKAVEDLLVFLILGVVITTVVEAMHAARRREESGRRWLSAVLASIGDAVIATDAHGRVLLMNSVAESLCGWRGTEAASRPLDEVFHIVNEQTRAAVESPAVRVLSEGVIVGLANHTLLISRDGTERPIDDSGAPIRGIGGGVDGVVLVFRDVTERRLAEARIAEEGRRKDEFLAMLAHELRNPLAAIANAVQLLMHPGAEGVQEWCREVIERQVRQLTRLVDDLLDISRISRGKIQLRPQPVELSTIIRSAAQAVRPLIDERGHELRLSLAPGPIELEADPVRLEQVLVNLFNNAAKYTEPGGLIEMEATQEEDQAVIRVTDTGIGIGPDLLPRVFELFTQGDRTPARSEGGLGIGLTMVQKLVEMHGGRVSVSSDGPGRGSTFLVRLPARPVMADFPTDSQLPTGQPAPARILLVDDHGDLARSLASLLRLDGHVVVSTDDGREAAAAARDLGPELVLLDLAMSGMDGYEVLRRLREEPATRHARIIALTGYAQEDERRRALEAGFDGLLAKPVDRATLTSLLGELRTRPALDRGPVLEADHS
jgi:PAS domain S-box-containing protein